MYWYSVSVYNKEKQRNPRGAKGGGGMSRVLLVSGSDRSREDLTREITESGWPCVGAADAAQARALLQGEEFALIIADTPLPETGALLREVLDGTASMVLLLARAGFAHLS